MKKTILLTLAALVGIICGWLLITNPSFQDLFSQYVENGEILTLEAKYSPEKVANDHRQELIADALHTMQDPSLKFYPYLLMDVKYIHQDKKPREGVLLWSQVDGEMVLDTDQWETSHGFADTMLAKANKDDFKILNTLAKYGGTLSFESLLKEMQFDADDLEPMIQSTIDKHLVIRKGNVLLLHFENPKILVLPQTRFKQNLVKKPYSQVVAIPKKFSRSEIEKIAQAAFGSDFTVRRTREIYLPIYNLDILNPDGSTLTTHWNALTNQRIDKENHYPALR